MNIVEYNSKEILKNEVSWSNKLKDFLEDLLKKIISVKNDDINISETQFQDYFNDDCMVLWKKAFTHDSFSETFNLEMLEFLGDKILKCIFIRWFIYEDPDLERSKFTSLEISIMNGLEQGRISKLLGMEPHIRCITNTLVMQPILADVFESFTGALFQTTKILFGIDMGYVMVNNFIDLIFRNYLTQGYIESKLESINYKSYIIQLFFKLPEEYKYLKVYDDKDERSRIFSETIKLNEHQRKLILNNLGISLSKIGYGEGKTFKEASTNAYKNAYETLIKVGVNEDWSRRVKQEFMFMGTDMEKTYLKLIKLLKSKGYSSFNIASDANTKIIDFYAYKNDSEKILVMNRTFNIKTFEEDQNELIKTIVDNFKNLKI